jgi:putative addiction module antidote
MPKVIKIGNSYGVVLPRECMMTIGLNPGDDVEITARGSLLEVQPVVKHPKLRPELEQAFNRTIDKFDDDLRRLAQ